MFVVTTYLAPLLLIAGLITIHEFGHFIVAKLCGVRVKVFSLGIGGRLFGFKWGDTDYRVSMFPFGGYVLMAGADPFMDAGADEEDTRGPGAFMGQPAWKRLLIVFAGPAMNLVLPFVVFTGLKLAGEPQPRAEIGTVWADSTAAKVGLRPEDEIVSVGGTPTKTWYDVIEAFEDSTGGTIDLVVDRAGVPVSATLPVAPETPSASRDPYYFGMTNSVPDTTIVVDSPASPVARAGLLTGDVITAVAGQPVRTWNEVSRLALAGAGQPLSVSVHRPGVDDGRADLSFALRPDETWTPAPEPADDTLWTTWGLVSATVSIGSFGTDSAAEKAGLAKGDRMLAIEGQPIRAWHDVVAAVSASGSGEGSTLTTRGLTITYRRDGAVQQLAVTPEVVKDTDELARYRYRPLLGIGGAGGFVAAPMVARPYPLGQSFQRATRETATVASFIVEQLGKLVTGEASPTESLGGPVEIFRQAQAAAERGIYDYARQLGLFSISLGIINLLPIPVLDGGQIVMYLAEWVRGRPLPLVLRERAQQAGVIFLVLLMLFVLVFDIHRAAVG